MHEGPEPPTTRVSVLDPAGYWVDPRLDCGASTMHSTTIIDYAADAPGQRGDPIDLARTYARRRDISLDAVEEAEYPAGQAATIRLRHNGRTVAVLYYNRPHGKAEPGGWLLGSTEEC